MARAWLYVSIESPSEPEADLLAEGLLAAGATSVQHEAGRVITWLPDDGHADARMAALGSALEGITAHPVALTWERRADADWAKEWRRGLAPRRVGRRLVLTPTWITPDTGPNDIVITIDPQMAFGTGEHATTRGVLALLEGVVETGVRVLDVGTGSGVLAIAAVRLGAGYALAVDNDADALINASENVLRNGAGDSIELREALVDAAFLRAAGPFDVIVANVLSSVLRPLLPAFHDALRAGGALILSGILEAEAESMRRSAAAAGFETARELREEEWWTALFRPVPPEPALRPDD
jgi:ribosomal protein L11 methyltransferase